MAEYRLKSRRKVTGGLRHSRKRCDKKLAWKGNPPTLTKLAPSEMRKKVKGRGKTSKVKLYKFKKAVVSKDGKSFLVDVKQVLKNDANRHYVRQNIATRGAIIEVELDGKSAKAVVTSRPGQHGIVQAKLLEEDKA